ncbi:MAG TPA: ScyD/ScyE family protein [Nocardioidaceae bacterium]|nr:ScyD/ScyE family protein [Nocardioidaceae bacterium]
MGALMAVAILPALAGHSQANSQAKSGSIKQIAELSGPRGVASVGWGKTLVTEDNGNFDLVIERKHGDAKVVNLGNIGPGFGNAIDNRGKTVYILTGGGGTEADLPPGAATLFKWKPGWDEAKPFADIAAYQATDPDPYDQENIPEDSNPFGLAVDPRGGVLVSDAAGNDLLKVHFDGSITTIARLKPRLVKVPDGLPATDPDGNPLPPAGTPILSEDVATSVTIGADGYYYVGELRGFPGTPGTSQIWRINPHAKNAVCDPKHPYRGMCQRYVDHLTSIVDLGADRWGNIYAVTLSKMSWLAVELGVPGSEVGAVYKIHKSHGAHGHVFKHELARNKLILPGGVDVSWSGKVYEVGPVFGQGALSVIR